MGLHISLTKQLRDLHKGNIGKPLDVSAAFWVCLKGCAKAADPEFDDKKVQFWRHAAAKIGPEASPQTLIALSLVFGLPPLIYPSCKPVTTSPGYSGSYKHFAGEVAPNPALQTCDPALAYEAIKEKFSEPIAQPFECILDALPDHQWVINPADHFLEATLAAYLFVKRIPAAAAAAAP